MTNKTIEQQIEELEELSQLPNPTSYAFSNEKVSNIAKESLLIIKELQEENKNLKAKLDYVGDTSCEDNFRSLKDMIEKPDKKDGVIFNEKHIYGAKTHY